MAGSGRPGGAAARRDVRRGGRPGRRGPSPGSGTDRVRACAILMRGGSLPRAPVRAAPKVGSTHDGTARGQARRLFPLFLLLPLCMACQVPRWPVAGTVRSPFGIRLMGLRPDLHRGVDVSAPQGTPVHPLLNGRVRFAGVMQGYGSVVWIDHGESLLSLYAHLSQIRVQAGQAVDQGQVLGLTRHVRKRPGPPPPSGDLAMGPRGGSGAILGGTATERLTTVGKSGPGGASVTRRRVLSPPAPGRVRPRTRLPRSHSPRRRRSGRPGPC